MSTTPRPWRSEGAWVKADSGPIATTLDNPGYAALIASAVNAFDVLLSVAKAAEWRERDYDDGGGLECSVCWYLKPEHDPRCVFAALTAQYPGWREWAS